MGYLLALRPLVYYKKKLSVTVSFKLVARAQGGGDKEINRNMTGKGLDTTNLLYLM